MTGYCSGCGGQICYCKEIEESKKLAIKELSSRKGLFRQLSELMRNTPHHPDCRRQPPVEDNVICTCDIGDKLTEAFGILVNVIDEVTDA